MTTLAGNVTEAVRPGEAGRSASQVHAPCVDGTRGSLTQVVAGAKAGNSQKTHPHPILGKKSPGESCTKSKEDTCAKSKPICEVKMVSVNSPSVSSILGRGQQFPHHMIRLSSNAAKTTTAPSTDSPTSSTVENRKAEVAKLKVKSVKRLSLGEILGPDGKVDPESRFTVTLSDKEAEPKGLIKGRVDMADLKNKSRVKVYLVTDEHLKKLGVNRKAVSLLKRPAPASEGSVHGKDAKCARMMHKEERLGLQDAGQGQRLQDADEGQRSVVSDTVKDGLLEGVKDSGIGEITEHVTNSTNCTEKGKKSSLSKLTQTPPNIKDATVATTRSRSNKLATEQGQESTIPQQGHRLRTPKSTSSKPSSTEVSAQIMCEKPDPSPTHHKITKTVDDSPSRSSVRLRGKPRQTWK